MSYFASDDIFIAQRKIAHPGLSRALRLQLKILKKFMDIKDLHIYQQHCVAHILAHKKCGLFLDMGLGKTVITLTAIEKLMFDYCEINSVLVIAPKRITESVWDVEAQKWDHLKHLRFSKIIGTQKQRLLALNEKADIYLISRDNISWLCGLYGTKLPFDMIVIDELSSFKSHRSQRFKALKTCQPNFVRFVGLTGTPAPNSLIDLWPQIYFMDRGERLGKTITAYRARYFSPGKQNGNIVYSYSLLKGANQEIHQKLSDICISMKAEDYISMPLRTDNYIELSLPKELHDKYEEFERDKVLELISNEEAIAVTNAAALSNKLLQFSNGAIYTDDSEVVPIHDIKLEAAKEIVENANGQPVLIAWQYRFDRDRLMECLHTYRPRELKTLQDITDWNNGDVQVMLAHPASAGHGLNLQAGGNIILWFGLTWSLELYKQFNSRLYRQGQTKNVIVNHLVMKNTHEVDVLNALRRKEISQNALLDSLKARIKQYSNLFK